MPKKRCPKCDNEVFPAVINCTSCSYSFRRARVEKDEPSAISNSADDGDGGGTRVRRAKLITQLRFQEQSQKEQRREERHLKHKRRMGGRLANHMGVGSSEGIYCEYSDCSSSLSECNGDSNPSRKKPAVFLRPMKGWKVRSPPNWVLNYMDRFVGETPLELSELVEVPPLDFISSTLQKAGSNEPFSDMSDPSEDNLDLPRKAHALSPESTNVPPDVSVEGPVYLPLYDYHPMSTAYGDYMAKCSLVSINTRLSSSY